jgi:hypothetical protein
MGKRPTPFEEMKMFLRQLSYGLSLAITLVVLALAFGNSAPCPAKEPSSEKVQPKSYVEFNGQRFYQAYTEEKGEQGLVEYLPQGENLDHWNELMSVAYFGDYPKELGAEGYLQNKLKDISSRNPPAQYEVLKAKGSDASVLAFLLVVERPKEIFAEWNLMRFYFSEKTGLLVVQYAKRQYYPNNDKFILDTGPELRQWRAASLEAFLKADFIEKKK